jgi:transposase
VENSTLPLPGLAQSRACRVLEPRWWRSNSTAIRSAGSRGHLIKLLFWDGQGLVLYAKRLDRGHFVWPATGQGVVSLTPAQLAMLTEGIDWRAPARIWKPELAG